MFVTPLRHKQSTYIWSHPVDTMLPNLFRFSVGDSPYTRRPHSKPFSNWYLLFTVYIELTQKSLFSAIIFAAIMILYIRPLYSLKHDSIIFHRYFLDIIIFLVAIYFQKSLSKSNRENLDQGGFVDLRIFPKLIFPIF